MLSVRSSLNPPSTNVNLALFFPQTDKEDEMQRDEVNFLKVGDPGGMFVGLLALIKRVGLRIYKCRVIFT